jgi:hypothetical protein
MSQQSRPHLCRELVWRRLAQSGGAACAPNDPRPLAVCATVVELDPRAGGAPAPERGAELARPRFSLDLEALAAGEPDCLAAAVRAVRGRDAPHAGALARGVFVVQGPLEDALVSRRRPVVGARAQRAWLRPHQNGPMAAE